MYIYIYVCIYIYIYIGFTRRPFFMSDAIPYW